MNFNTYRLLEGINILVVEDNLLNQKIVGFILQKQHAIVKMALNGREAINILQHSSYDMVLMDLQMPEMDGYETIKYIRQTLKKDMPIIALTAGMLADEWDECKRIGADTCITKPVEPAGLCDLIVDLIKSHKKN